jgi:hypothetical protein
MTNSLNLFFSNDDKNPVMSKSVQRRLDAQIPKSETKVIDDIKEVETKTVDTSKSLDKKSLKKMFQDNIKFVSSMGVQTYTLYRKWHELNEIEWSEKDKQRMIEIKNNIWIPEQPNDFEKLEPEVIIADASNKEISYIWTMLRRMISTAIWSQSPGRFGKFLVRDKITQKYLGVISIGSDFISIGGRDKYIGWSMKNKMDEHKLNHLCMASSIVPTQPLGYNYTGGKLIAMLSTSDVIENFWNKKYSETLIGITTTSLYNSVKEGGVSQYTGLKMYKSCEPSDGKIPVEPEESVYVELKKWIKENLPNKFAELMAPRKGGPASHVRPRILSIAHKELGVKTVNNDFSRGVYFCELYKNSNDFLCGKDDKVGERKFDNSVDALSLYWKKKYASKRIKKLITEGKNNKDILFYDGLIGISFEEAKERFLNDIGR